MAQPGWFSQRNKMHVMGMWWGDDGHVAHSFLKINHFDSFWYTLGILGLFRAGGCSSISILAGVFAARLKSCEVDITDYRVLAVENKENISRVLQVVSSPDPWLVTEYIQISKYAIWTRLLSDVFWFRHPEVGRVGISCSVLEPRAKQTESWAV